ncbi:methyltransferase domain-containing protein [Kitasatospora cathayae]|uniref:Methyltransferase domain-containing protein n=1 Tax=Kitasatospora cathayae TaxID=3004092 RepID=A0ABY7PXE4_9ACTN|nr:methyltransferase domain-containing protein [Kitasatospora sp. HUAS 3-15]WBP85094.1 methyltransferase domain-containing protein [Kitasatospora sp. HUAS 3-15]
MTAPTPFRDRVIDDGAAAVRGLTVALGERLGLYRALAGAGPLTPKELADRTGVHLRYATEWLHAQASAGYVEHDPEPDTYRLPDDHAAVLADPDSPGFVAAFFTALKALYATEDQLVQAYRNGGGVEWSDHHDSLDTGMGSFFLPGYRAHLVRHWLPALDGVVDRLRAGGRVADVGCGVGHSTLIMAEAFPEASFHGFDYSAVAIEHARELARRAGLADRVRFDVAPADAFPGQDYDLISYFNVLHDLGDPVTAARWAHRALAPEGVWMIVEPNAHAALGDNRNPAGRMFMSLSAVMCLPVAAAQHGPHALGNHAGEDALRAIAEDAGFTRWRRATETAVSAVYQARR